MTIAASVAVVEYQIHLQESFNDEMEVDIDVGEGSGRSMHNVAVWRSYLPADCVDTMIAMGWDETT
jgi:hypothetical protein